MNKVLSEWSQSIYMCVVRQYIVSPIHTVFFSLATKDRNRSWVLSLVVRLFVSRSTFRPSEKFVWANRRTCRRRSRLMLSVSLCITYDQTTMSNVRALTLTSHFMSDIIAFVVLEDNGTLQSAIALARSIWDVFVEVGNVSKLRTMCSYENTKERHEFFPLSTIGLRPEKSPVDIKYMFIIPCKLFFFLL